MKLTKLYIHNYKSFYDTTIELDKMNIVVGENNSGKSNLIDVLEFIDIAMSKDIERAISDKGGYDNLKNYSAIGEEKVIVRVTFSKKITFSFSFSKTYSILSVSLEAKYIYSHKRYNNKNQIYTKIFICSGKEKTIYSPTTIESDIKLFQTTHHLSTYCFNTEIIRDKSNQDSKNNRLLKDGSNLGKILYEIKEKDKNNFEIISNSLISTVNEIDSIEVQKVLGSYVIGFKERKEEPIPLYKVSNGTISFIATITALNQNSDNFLLVFEEPEQHLHLNVVTYILEAFRDSDKQILITTHSTEILKYANLDEIIFIYRDSDGDTQSIRADAIPNLKRKMKQLAYKRDVTLDELIGDGMIGTFE